MATVFQATSVATFDDPLGGFYQRIFDFNAGPYGTNSIWFGSVENATSIALELEQNGQKHRLEVANAIVAGEEATWTTSISDTAQYTILKNGIELGDTVFTLDNRFQTLRWVGKRHLTLEDLDANDKLRPIRISKTAVDLKI